MTNLSNFATLSNLSNDEQDSIDGGAVPLVLPLVALLISVIAASDAIGSFADGVGMGYHGM